MKERGRAMLIRHHAEGWSLKRLAQAYKLPAKRLAMQMLRLRQQLRDCGEPGMSKDDDLAIWLEAYRADTLTAEQREQLRQLLSTNDNFNQAFCCAGRRDKFRCVFCPRSSQPSSRLHQ